MELSRCDQKTFSSPYLQFFCTIIQYFQTAFKISILFRSAQGMSASRLFHLFPYPLITRHAIFLDISNHTVGGVKSVKEFLFGEAFLFHPFACHLPHFQRYSLIDSEFHIKHIFNEVRHLYMQFGNVLCFFSCHNTFFLRVSLTQRYNDFKIIHSEPLNIYPTIPFSGITKRPRNTGKQLIK